MELAKYVYTREQIIEALDGNGSDKLLRQMKNNPIEEGRYYRPEAIIDVIKKMADMHTMSIRGFKSWLVLLNYCIRRKWMSEASFLGGAKLISEFKSYLSEKSQDNNSCFTKRYLYEMIAEIKYFDYRLKHHNETKPEEFLSDNIARYVYYDYRSNFDLKEYYKILVIDREKKLYHEEIVSDPLYNPSYCYVFLNNSSFSTFDIDDFDDYYDDEEDEEDEDEFYDDASMFYRSLLCECIKNGYQSEATLKSA